jgi:hypothetical protein
MSRTIRALNDRMCLRRQSNRPHKVEQSLLRELQQDLDLHLSLGNRALYKAVPEPYDDKCVAGLMETKHQWRHGQLPRPKKRYRD